MFDFVLESPVTILLVGAIVTGVTAYGALQTGNRLAWQGSATLGVLTIVLVALSLWIDTDREEVREFVLETARELEANESDKVIAKIHPQATHELLEARSRLASIQFNVAKIKTFHGIDVKSTPTGRTATVRMNAYIEAVYQGNRGSAPRWVQLSLEEQEGLWRIVALEQRAPHYESLNAEGRMRLNQYRLLPADTPTTPTADDDLGISPANRRSAP
jgi:hypothetical protein